MARYGRAGRVHRTTPSTSSGETFLTAWRRLDVVPPGDEARLWLYAVTRRILADHYRGAAGHDTTRMSDRGPSALRATRAGFVFQQFHLAPGASALENVAAGPPYAGRPPAERRERAREALHRVGLGHRLGHRPHRLPGGRAAAGRARPRGARAIRRRCWPMSRPGTAVRSASSSPPSPSCCRRWAASRGWAWAPWSPWPTPSCAAIRRRLPFWTLAGTGAATLVVGVLAGCHPAVHASRLPPTTALASP
ncbi:hypothetical protein [Actinomadura pelletieri]|uniref:hypothetical protein n=1 Tax=Actinomadura pelletieri TaxID=111805 RepID=UPI001B87FA3B